MLNFIIAHQVKIGHRHLRKKTQILILNFVIKIYHIYFLLKFILQYSNFTHYFYS
jgi:hypothetical protein